MEMSKLYRQVPQKAPRQLLTLNSSVFSVGSCFAEHMAGRLSQNRVDIYSNPTGVLYNPVSIQDLMQRIVTQKELVPEEIFQKDGEYRSFHTYTQLNKPTAEEYLETVNGNLRKAREYVKKSSLILITLGTAFCWKLNKTGEVVANCQKEPGIHFTKELLSEVHVVKALQNVLDAIHTLNNSATIIFTVSPIRYEKKNPFLNSVSKGRLFSALEQIVDQQSVCYFPAYEILMDELRDYRFYASDLTHPATISVDIIWDRLINEYCDTHLLQFIEAYAPILQAKSHKVSEEKRDKNRHFSSLMLKRVTDLEERFSVSLDDDRHFFTIM